MEDAAKGVVSWDTSTSVKTYMKTEKAEAIEQRKQVMGQMQLHEGLNEEEMKMLNQQQERDQEDITEDAMLSIMGEASGKGPKPAHAAEAETPATVEELEARLKASHDQTKMLEEELQESFKQI